jgi:O-antigen/teichoic acid export membrane protein
MRSAIPATLLLGWLVPLLITAALYYGAMKYEQGNSRDGWGAFGLFAIAPYFFSVVGILNLWILALRRRKKRVVFSFGLVLPLVGLVLLIVL